MIRVIHQIPLDKLKLLIFDLDGTLVDSELDLAHAINAMLRHYSRPELPVDIIGSYIGDGAPMLVRRSLGDPQDEHFVQEALLYFMKYYREHKLDNTYAYKGVPEALRALRERSNGRLKMTVLTNKPIGPSQGIIEGLGMREFFVQVYGGNSFETKKPDPLGALKLLEETGIRPQEAVMIGDSQNDILTARNAGMWCLGVTYGFAPETLEKHPPDVLIDEPGELVPALIGTSRPSDSSSEIPASKSL
jgi:phosphoglycolate phosphatase